MRNCFQLLLLFGFFALSVGAQPQDAKSDTASVAGRVTRGDKPLAGILVTANRANPFNGWQPTGVTAKTDEDGRYQLTNLATGQYLISPHALADVVSSNDPSSQGKTVFVQAGEAVENFDFSLVKGGVITGTITDENGKPLVEAAVKLWTKTDRGSRAYYGSSSLYLMNRTDDRGVYRLFGLPPGKYLVSVGGESDTASAQRKYGGIYYPQTFYPNVTNEAEAKAVEVTADSESTSIDIKFGKAEKTYTARGRIIDATTGIPLVGVRFGHTQVKSDGHYGTVGSERTNLQGAFQLSGLSPGSHAVYLAAEDGMSYYTDPKKFEILTSDVNDLEVKASLGNSLSGIVVVEGTKDADLLAEVRNFVLFLHSDQTDGQMSNRVIINLDGSFRVTGVRPGKIRFNMGFSAVLPKARPFIVRVEKNGQAWSDDIPLNAGENPANVRIVIGYGVGVIRGQINIIGGQPADVGQVRVVLNALSGGSSRDSRQVMADANGRFYIEGLLPGEYQIIASPNPAVTAGKNSKPPVRQSFTVTGEKETQITLTIDLTEEEK